MRKYKSFNEPFFNIPKLYFYPYSIKINFMNIKHYVMFRFALSRAPTGAMCINAGCWCNFSINI